jgi:hypothetical protein
VARAEEGKLFDNPLPDLLDGRKAGFLEITVTKVKRPAA